MATSRKIETCPRCGHRRQRNESVTYTTELCGSCKLTEPEWPNITPTYTLPELFEQREELDAMIEAEIARIETAARQQRAEARRLRAQHRELKRRSPAKCGTDGGYYRHIRTIGEPACQPCLDAHSLAERDRREAHNERRLAAELIKAANHAISLTGGVA